jgi:hypothetical protein
MAIALDRDAADVDAYCREVLVAVRVLDVGHRSGLVCDQAREAVPRLVDVDIADARGCIVRLQIVGERVRGERQTGRTGEVVARPEGRFYSERRSTIARGEELEERRGDGRDQSALTGRSSRRAPSDRRRFPR